MTVAGAELLRRLAALPDDWPLAGSLRPAVLARLADHALTRSIRCSAETGTGKSTLLLSQLSSHHVVFAIDDAGRGDSLAAVRTSTLLRPENVEFIVGPSQRTLATYRFTAPLDLVLIDGAHGYPFTHLDYYFLYPHLAAGAVLVLDDIHVRSVNDLFRFLRTDPMFDPLEVVHTTAFFRRTATPTFDPLGDDWWLQRYNRTTLPPLAGLPLTERIKSFVPARLMDTIRRLRGSHLGSHRQRSP